jgi:hypothetical protein
MAEKMAVDLSPLAGRLAGWRSREAHRPEDHCGVAAALNKD